MSSLHPTHLEDLRKSGLSDETIREAGFQTVIPCDINKEIGWNVPGLTSCYRIPYPGTDFCRYRCFYEEGASGPRYLQRKATGNRLYVPHSVKSVLQDTAVDLYTPEGEKKALEAAQEGLFCIGLSGLWNWKNKNEEELIADFDRIALEGRRVFIVPDSDWLNPNKHGYKKNLSQAVHGLGTKLKERGARVFIVSLPDENEGKTGLDDYLIKHTAEEFRALPVTEVLSLKERAAIATAENYKELMLEIANLSPVERDLITKTLALRLGVSITAVRNEIKAVQFSLVEEKQKNTDVERSFIEDIEPSDTQVNGSDLLDEVYSVFATHAVLTPSALVACTLWTVLTYCYDSFRILPLLGITSPEKRCGKTTLLEVLAGLTNKPLLASNITSSAIFRTIEKYRPCLLIDEADTFLRDNDELRGIINSGHTRKSAFIIRTNTETLEPERFSTWGPKAISLIGKLPDTLTDRAIAVKMERKTISERVKRVSLDFDGNYLTLRRMCARWALDNAGRLKDAAPGIPASGNDRAEDNWLPIISIADLAGGNWPDRARNAMLTIEGSSDNDTITQTLLKDVREIFNTHEKLSSAELVQRLIAIEDHPWGDWRKGRPITQNGLARLLRPFGIISKTIRIDANTPKGYTSKQFADVFKRYLPDQPPIQSATTTQTAPVKALRGFQSATQEVHVAVEKQRKPTPVASCGDVAVENRVREPGDESENEGCDFYQTTGDCRAAYEIELKSLQGVPGLEGLGCRAFQVSGRCPAADGIAELMTAGG